MTAAAAVSFADNDPNDRLGAVTGPREVTFERVLPGPIERVWAFIVDGEKRKTWLASGEIEPRVGGKVGLVFDNSTLTVPGEKVPERFAKHACAIESNGRVTAWDPPGHLAFSWWGEPDVASEVSFTLEAVAGGKVKLTLVHRALTSRAEMLGVSGGWHAHLGVLEARLENRDHDEFWGVFDKVEPTYDRAIPKD